MPRGDILHGREHETPDGKSKGITGTAGELSASSNCSTRWLQDARHGVPTEVVKR